MVFSRPSGTGVRFAALPGVETPGYCRASLRDAALKLCALQTNSEAIFSAACWSCPNTLTKFSLRRLRKDMAATGYCPRTMRIWSHGLRLYRLMRVVGRARVRRS
jgi:hypothetical protein